MPPMCCPIEAARAAGCVSLGEIAQTLTNRGIRTPADGVQWRACKSSACWRASRPKLKREAQCDFCDTRAYAPTHPNIIRKLQQARPRPRLPKNENQLTRLRSGNSRSLPKIRFSVGFG
jgi:hypothetical protein